VFQSHAGSIEASRSESAGVVLFSRFNPTLVRLRPLIPNRSTEPNHMFQSHAGSIEAVFGIIGPHGPNVFQSHAGSIEARWEGSPGGGRGQVSIPRWFD